MHQKHGYLSKTVRKFPDGFFPFQLDENALRFCPRQAAADIYCVFSFRHPRTVKPGNYNIVYDPCMQRFFFAFIIVFASSEIQEKTKKSIFPRHAEGEYTEKHQETGGISVRALLPRPLRKIHIQAALNHAVIQPALSGRARAETNAQSCHPA